MKKFEDIFRIYSEEVPARSEDEGHKPNQVQNIKRAPMWMQKHNLEWVYRLVQDPKRLFKRYWSTNTKFIWNAMIRGK